MQRFKTFLHRQFSYMTAKDWATWPIVATLAILPAYLFVGIQLIGALMIPATIVIIAGHLTPGGAELMALLDQFSNSPSLGVYLPMATLLFAVPLAIWLAKPAHPINRAIAFAHERRAFMNGELL